MKKYGLLFLLFLLTTTPYWIAGTILLLKDPLIERDEYIMFDITQHLARDHKLTTDIYGTFAPEAHGKVTIYPPVYFTALSGWFSAFGSNVLTQRLFSFTLGGFALLTLFTIIIMLTNNATAASVGTLMLSIDPRFGESSRHGRMEIMVVLWILLALASFLGNPKSRIRLWISGVLSALAVLTHPMGIIAPGIIIVLISMEKTSIRKKIQDWLVILLPSALGAGAWLWSIRDSFSFLVLQLDFLSIQKLQSSSAVITLFLTNGTYVMLFGMEAIVAVISTYIALKNKSRPIMISLVAMGITAIIVVLGKEVWYVAYLSPIIALVSAFLLSHAMQHHNRVLQIITAGIITIILLTSSVTLIQLSRERSGIQYTEFSQPFVQYFKNSKGIVCIASTPDPSYELRSNPNLTINQLYDVSGFIPRKKRFFDSCDWFVGNLNPGDYGIAYLMRNGQTRQIIEYPDTLPIEIVQLRPLNERN